MFCQKCGKEIMDEAVVCIHCGCATSNAPSARNEHTSDWIAIKEFASKAKTTKIWGIISLCLVLGIGVIPGLITVCIAGGVDIPNITTTNPVELAEFEQAKKNLDAGKRLGAGAMGINLGLWIMAISIMMGM